MSSARQQRRRVFLGPIKTGRLCVPVLYPNLRKRWGREKVLFTGGVFSKFTEPVVEIVPNIADAEFILLPHHPKHYSPQEISRLENLAHEKETPLLIFMYEDADDLPYIRNAIIFKLTQYKSTKPKNVLMLPAHSEDLTENGEPSLRTVKNERPVVGFCGWASFKNPARHVKKQLGDYGLFLLDAFSKDDIAAKRNGVLLRREVIRRLRTVKYIRTNFIIRRTFSGHRNDIELDPATARDEYVKNMTESDLCLAVRGDGNASVRFYEALSLARIPLFIDTDIELPLEDVIDYDAFMIRVPHRNLNALEERICAFWEPLSLDAFLSKQRAARSAYENYLRYDSYFQYVFGHLEELVPALRKTERGRRII